MQINNRKIFFGLILCCQLLIVPMVSAIELTGYYEGQLTGFVFEEKALWQLSNRLRLDLSADVGENATANASVIGMTYHGYTDYNLIEILPNEVQQTIRQVFGSTTDTLFVYQYEETQWSIDNAFITVYPGLFTFRLGRQQLPWGTGYAWNPSDIFNTKSLVDPTYEKPGQDAFKAEWGFGDSGGVVAVLLPGATWQETTRALKLKLQIKNFDLSMSWMNEAYEVIDLFNQPTIEKETRQLIAADFVGQVGEFGIWSEGAFFQGPGNAQNWQMVIGCDTTFEFQTSLMIEYYRNWDGYSDKQDYQIQDWVDLIMGQRTTLGRDYLMVMLSHPAHDLVTITCMSIINLNDHSFGLIPSVEYNYSDNVVMTLTGNIFSGDSESEYGGLDIQGGYLRVKAFF